MRICWAGGGRRRRRGEGRGGGGEKGGEKGGEEGGGGGLYPPHLATSRHHTLSDANLVSIVTYIDRHN